MHRSSTLLKMCFKRVLIALFFSITALGLNVALLKAQGRTDSLKRVVRNKEEAETSRINAMVELAREFLHKEPDSSRLFGRRALRLSKQKGYEKGVAKAMNAIGVYHRQRGITDSALYYYKRTRKKYEELGDSLGIAKVLLNLANLYNQTGKNDRAHRLYRKSKKIARRAKGKDSRIYHKASISHGILFKDLGQYEKAMEVYHSILDEVRESGERGDLASLYNNIGVVHKIRSEHEQAIRFYRKSLRIEKEEKDPDGISSAYMNIGNVQRARSKFDSALHYHEKALKICERADNKGGKAKVYANMANVHFQKGDYDRSIELMLKAARIFDELGRDQILAKLYNNIGLIHLRQNKFDQSKEYFRKSLKANKKAGSTRGIARNRLNIASAFSKEGRLQKALEKYKKSLSSYEKLGVPSGKGKALANIGTLYLDLYSKKDSAKSEREKEFPTRIERFLDSAGKYLKGAQKIRRKLGDLHGRARTQKALGDLYLQKGSPGKAVPHYKASAELADSIGIKLEYYEAKKGLADAYEKLGEPAKAYQHYKEYIKVRDSVHNKETKQKVAKLEKKYKAQKKEKKIALLKKEKEKQRAIAAERSRRQRTIIYSVSGVLLIVAVFSIFLYQRFRVTNKQKRIIEEQKEKVDEAYATLQEKNQELEEANGIIRGQKEQVEEAHREITDSINYAQRIQKALLQTPEHRSPHLPPHFILLKPQATVSGDFYWAYEKQGHLYLAAVDCTGHGVPGAFMSMLGVSFLNDIMSDEDLPTPGQVLTRLKERVTEELTGQGSEGTSRDGMDAAIVRIPVGISDPNSGPSTKEQGPEGHLEDGRIEVQFAGAQNPLYVIRKGIASAPPSALYLDDGTPLKEDRLKPFKHSEDGIEIKGDPIPIGYTEEGSGGFKSISLRLCKEDALYLFSDGFADQFGGPKGKKFLYSSFKQLLNKVQEEDMEGQKAVLERTFEEWKDETEQEQVDDVLVIGLRL